MTRFPYVHPTAIIDENVDLHPTVVVGARSKIGKGCILSPFSVVGEDTILGEANALSSFCVIGARPQDKKSKIDDPFGLICGHGNQFREGVTISKGTSASGRTIIGDENLWMANSHLAHDSIVGNRCVFANGVSIAGHVEIGDDVQFGGHSAVHQFAQIGRLAFIAANAMVSQNVPPFCLVAGDHAQIRGLNLVGLQRAGISKEDRLLLKRAYHQLCRKTMMDLPLNYDDGSLHLEFKSFLEMSASSKRHLCSVYRKVISTSA
jgi:UDP-N-acetylglucosamine acyltransferase